MSKESRKFKVPDELANLYDFVNSLDIRHFAHHGVQRVQSDALTDPRELAAWMSERGLLVVGARITPAMFDAALQLRKGIRAYLACDPAERRKDKNAIRSFNSALRAFPMVVEACNDRDMTLVPARGDPLAGMSEIAAELYVGSVKGTLGRLKMCAADECRRVFFDRSKPATRRWCMSTLCGNRMKTRTYRERHRNAG